MADSLVSLLDVNVLIAMCFPEHEFFPPVSRWLQANRSHGWATSPLTQAGFASVSAQTRANLSPSIEHSIRLLEKNCAEPDHIFWPQDNRVTTILPEIRARLVGPQQLTDALLLDLAIQRGGRFVTLDRKALHLLPAGSPHQSAIEIISEE